MATVPYNRETMHVITSYSIHYTKLYENWVPDGPLVLGHEPGGVIVEVGSKVTNLKVGDRVAIEPGVPCGECEECRKGLYNLCKSVKFMAIPKEKDGVFSEYCAHDASMCFKLPENVFV